MTTESREHLSSLMDGEISRETGRFLVRRLGTDEELCATWARYHLVRDCLRHGGGRFADEGMSGRVRRAIERESLPAAPRRKVPTWLKPAAGLAIAASVALMAIVAVGPAEQPAQRPTAGLADSVPTGAFTSPQNLSPTPLSTQVSRAGAAAAGNNSMNPYLLRHYQATGSTGGKGFVAFVPIVITSSAQADNSGQDDGSEQAAEQVGEREEDARHQ
jgi:sigma-E factor negative regulatory protein RseA